MPVAAGQFHPLPIVARGHPNLRCGPFRTTGLADLGAKCESGPGVPYLDADAGEIPLDGMPNEEIVEGNPFGNEAPVESRWIGDSPDFVAEKLAVQPFCIPS